MILDNILKIILLGILFLIFSCEKKMESEASYKDLSSKLEQLQETSIDTSYSSGVTPLTSSAAVEKKIDTLKKFIRTADIKFKVKDVINSTYKIEEIISHSGGFVTNTNLASTMDYCTITKVSVDSSLESTQYSVINNMTFRIPNTKLDETLKSIGALVEYMDYRIIKADDVGLQMLANNLKEKRMKRHEKRINKAIDKRGNNLFENTDAEETLLYNDEQSDNALLSNLSLSDQIQYSTVSLNIYQKSEIKNVLIANEKSVQAYEPPFAHKIQESFYAGWKMLESFIFFFVQIWGFVLLGILFFFLYRKYKHVLIIKKQ